MNKIDVLLLYVKDVFIDGAVVLIHLKPEDIQFIISAMEKFDLDFDDAYQYAAAEKYNLMSLLQKSF